MRLALTAASVLLIALFVIRADRFARRTSQTFDEGAHLVAGVSYWRTGDFRLNPEHPPLLKLYWAIPVACRSDVPFWPDSEAWERRDHWTIADGFLYDGPVRHTELLLGPRRMNIVLGAGLVALIGWWAYRLWGRTAGFLACGLAAGDPNLAAFAGLLSMDLGLALFGTAAGYALWEYTASGSRHWFYLAGVALGLALAAKFSAIVTVVGFGAGAIAFTVAGGRFVVPGADPGLTRQQRISAALAVFVRLGLIAAMVVVAAYGGLHAIDWARGLKQQLVRGDIGDPHYFLNGEISSTGWYSYFPRVLAVKTPPGTLLLAVVSAVAWRAGNRPGRREVAFLFIPAAVYFAAMTLSRIDIGWRVILPAYPALILVAARAATLVPAHGIGRWVGRAALVAAACAALLDIWHVEEELSYANGLAVGREDLHLYVGDSNIDWGQGLIALGEVIHEKGDPVIYLSYAGTARAEAYTVRYERLPGWGQIHAPPAHRLDLTCPVLVAVSASNLQGTYLMDPAMYRWLLVRPPVSRTDGSIWVWDVTGDDDALDRLRRLAARHE